MNKFGELYSEILIMVDHYPSRNTSDCWDLSMLAGWVNGDM